MNTSNSTPSAGESEKYYLESKEKVVREANELLALSYAKAWKDKNHSSFKMSSEFSDGIDVMASLLMHWQCLSKKFDRSQTVCFDSYLNAKMQQGGLERDVALEIVSKIMSRAAELFIEGYIDLEAENQRLKSANSVSPDSPASPTPVDVVDDSRLLTTEQVMERLRHQG